MADNFYQEYGPIERRRRAGNQPDREARPEQPEQPAPRPPMQQAHRPRRRLKMLLIGAFSTIIILGMIAGGGLWWLNRTFDGRIYPNVAIQGTDLSYLTPAEAKTALNERYDEFLQSPLTITFNGRTWEPSLEDLGVSLNTNAAVDQAYNLGRDGNMLTSIQAVAGIWQDGYDIPLALTIDATKIKAYLHSISDEFEHPPVNASLIIGGTSAAVVPAREGRLVQIDDTTQDIVNHLTSLKSSTVPLRTITIQPALLDSGVAEAKRTIDSILQSPLTLTAGERSWELTTDDLRAMILLEQIEGPNGIELRANLDEGVLRQRVATYADAIGRGSVNPRVAFNGGNLTIIREGRSGLRLDEEASAIRIREQATIGNTRVIELVVNEIEADVTAENLNNLGIVEAVGVGKSSFVGSAPYRIQNIKAGSNLLDGILIAPGEEFSFNEAIGTIDESNGFAKGYAIVNNRTQEEWGGGICQDSTTLFRAAFHAGLPITERHEHSFRISWYEVYETYGMDAAIFTGYLDLRFVNDTGNWLLLNTYIDDSTTTVTYVLYGTKPNREVIFQGPEVTKEYPKPEEPTYVADPKIPVGVFNQTDTARGGMDITVYRVIMQNGAVLSSEPFYTHFKPWPDIYVHNPATPLPPKGCRPNQPCAQIPPPAPVQPPVQPQPTPEPPVQPQPTPEATPEPSGEQPPINIGQPTP